MKRLFAIAALLIATLGLTPCVLAQEPTPTPEPPVIEVTLPTLTNGPLYYDMVTATNNLLKPVDDLADDIVGTIGTDPVTEATGITNSIALLWQYLDYFSNVLPSLLSMSVLLSFYLIVLLTKIVLSAIMYLKGLVAQWL